MGTFVVPFRVLSQKEFDRRKCVVVEILVLFCECLEVKASVRKLHVFITLRVTVQNHLSI